MRSIGIVCKSSFFFDLFVVWSGMFQKKIGLRPNLFVFSLFLLFYARLSEGIEKQRGCHNSGIVAKPSPADV